ncbi:MAG: hypothetical protein ACK5LX_06180 [Oscillospiraceae bacterium]
MDILMSKYLTRYIWLWLPATVLAFLPDGILPPATTFLAGMAVSAILLVGWAVNTAMFCYRRPLAALAVPVGLEGFSLLGILLRTLGVFTGRFSYVLFGLPSYLPLSPFVGALSDFPGLNAELAVTLVLLGCCLIGYGVGFINRLVNPNPYRPRLEE